VSQALRGMVIAAALAALVVAPAMVGPAAAEDVVTIGVSTTLSGSIAELGQTGLRGIQMAVDKLNSTAGILNKQIKVVSADDGASPANGASNVRHMILADKAVAIFGPVSSAVGTAEETVAGQYKTLFFAFTSNDIKITTTNFNKYAFQVVPNTVMEPRAIAYYFAENVAPKTGGKKLKIATITPNYSYGRDTVEVFLKTLRELRVNFEVVAQELPQLGATDYTSYISALLAAHPDYVFAAIFGGDLITFTKQAQGFNFFKQTRIVGFYDQVALRVLGADSPEGAIGWNRAPFWAENGPGFSEFLADYRAKFHDAPSPWAITGYSAVQVWAYGVRKAGSFDADKVVAALSGATVPTIRGEITLRACDHQAEVPEFIGPVSAKIDPQYGQPIYSHTVIVAADKTMLTCTQAKSRQP